VLFYGRTGRSRGISAGCLEEREVVVTPRAALNILISSTFREAAPTQSSHA
jgi:hypothetical protein